MSKRFLMDKQKILLYFSKLNELLQQDSVELEFYVNGGANMCLHVQTRLATHDVDTSTRPLDKDGGAQSGMIREYAERVGKMMNIPVSWLNTGGNLSVTPQMFNEVTKGIEMSHLTVWFFKWRVMLVQKISAIREQPDITDAVSIIRKYNVCDIEVLDGWMKELLGEWYSISSRYKAQTMLKHAWETEETSYIQLRTLLDTYGLRDQTVEYYTKLIITDMGVQPIRDEHNLALELFPAWIKQTFPHIAEPW